MEITLYGKLTEGLLSDKEWGVATAVLGKDTEFEAIYMITVGDDDGMWRGYLVFKDYRFSPPETMDGLLYGALQLQYEIPSAGNGVLARTRAENHWETLCGIFKGLMK